MKKVRIFRAWFSHLLHLPILAELLSSTFTITSASRKRTSEAKRPLVLKLMSIVIEPDAPDRNGCLPPLAIEKYDPESCSVTIYDPYKGLYTMPLSNLVSYNIISLILKRTSQKALICPKLIQQFCALSIKPPIPSSPSSFSIISLFDGSGSFTDVIANALQQWPHAILAAEMDADTRSVVSRVKELKVGLPKALYGLLTKRVRTPFMPKMSGTSSKIIASCSVNFSRSSRLIALSSSVLDLLVKT